MASRKPKRRLVWVTWQDARKCWLVTESNSRGDAFIHAVLETKADAVRCAVDFCNAEASHGEWLSLRIKRRDGQIEKRGERTYPRSSDPHPPRG